MTLGRWAAALAALVACAAAAHAQAPLFETPASPGRPARVTIQVSTDPAVAAPGRALTLQVDAIPAPGIHVYAPGNKGYIPVTLNLQLPPGITADAPVFPAGEDYIFGALQESVKIYKRPFRVRQVLTVARPTGPLDLVGTFRYQACDDRVCFPPATVPVRLTVPLQTAAKAPARRQ